MHKIYQIAYQNENPKSDRYCILRFAEVAAKNYKEARKIFYRNHHKSNRIVPIRFKRNMEVKKDVRNSIW